MATPVPADAHRDDGGNDFLLGESSTAAGARLPRTSLRYRVYGDPEAGRRLGWTLVFHDLAGEARVERWWGHHLRPGGALDPRVRPLLCAQLLPRHTEAPLPSLAPRDLAAMQDALLAHLRIERVALGVGVSLGGMVALEWARRARVAIDRLVVIAAPAVTSPQVIAWHEAQRMAIEAGGPAAGLAAARALATVLRRSSSELTARFGRGRTLDADDFDVARFLRASAGRPAGPGAGPDAAGWLALLRTADLHDLGDPERAGRETAARARRVVGVGISTDSLHPPGEVRAWVRAYARVGAAAEYREIASIHGHEAWLHEHDQVEAILAGRD